MECIGAIDQGTQSTRFTLFDKDAHVIASAQTALTQIYPQPGWCEQDPTEIMNTISRSIDTALENAQASVGKVKVVSVGITNQRETTVVWDRLTGAPLHNAIVWLDNRTSGICHELMKQFGGKDPFRRTTGLPISTYFSAVKLLWLMKNVPTVTKAVADGSTFHRWCFQTGCAKRLFMTEQWDASILEKLGINPVILPKIASNCEIYGHIQDGPLKDVPIAGALGDQHAALLGHRCQEGEAKNTYGTGCFLLLNTGTQLVHSTHGLISGIGHKLGPDAATQYMLEGSVAIAGSIFSWLKDQLGILQSIDEVEKLGASVENTGGVYFVPAFSGLFAPHWRDDARGVIVGLTGFTTKAHVVRAAMEAICFQTREVVDAMKLDANLEGLHALKVDGGASGNATLMQIQADLLQTVVERPQNQEATSLGAALAAGIAVRFYEAAMATRLQDASTTQFAPTIAAEQSERRYSKWKRAVEKSLDLTDLAD